MKKHFKIVKNNRPGTGLECLDVVEVKASKRRKFMKKYKTSPARELAESVSRFLSSFEADKIPKGFSTLLDLAPRLRVSDRQVYNIAQRFIKAGHAERQTFRVHVGSMIRPVPHYRFSKEAEKVLGLTKPRRQ